MAQTTDHGATHRSVLVYLAVNCAEMLRLLGWRLGPRVQWPCVPETAANAAEVAVEASCSSVCSAVSGPPMTATRLVMGESGSSGRCSPPSVPSSVGPGSLSRKPSRAALHPSLDHSYMVAYLVLAATIALDGFALEVALGPVRKDAASRAAPRLPDLQTSTDPAGVTVVVGGGCAVAGGAVAVLGLALSQLQARRRPIRSPAPLLACCCSGSSVLAVAHKPGFSPAWRPPADAARNVVVPMAGSH